MTSTEYIFVAAGIIGALITICGGIVAFFKRYNKTYDWVKKQNSQDNEISHIKQEQTLLCYCMSATLDGLIQLGCNHSVPDAKDKLDKYLNQKAHDQI